MSLEIEIKALTAALNRVADLMSVGTKQETVTPTKSQAPEPAATSQAEETSTTKGVGAAVLVLEDIKKAMMAMSANFPIAEGTAKSKAVLGRYGAVKLSQVSIDDYAEFIELCESVGAGGEV